jgi:hypothetical protein
MLGGAEPLLPALHPNAFPMAQEDRQSEQFIREVDEELRRAQLKAIWDRFAPLIIGVCVLVVLVTAGYRGWEWWQARQAAQAGDRYMAALQAIESGDRAEGEAQLGRIAEEGGDGYPALARLRIAGEKAAAGAKAEAVAAYDSVAADTAISPSLQGLARVRAALLALDIGDLKGAEERAAPLDEAGNPWRHAAREVLGTAAYQAGELQRARDYFTEIQQDAETPADLWYRSGMMVALIDGQLAPPGTPGQPAPAGGTAEPAQEAPVPAELPTPEAPVAPLQPAPGEAPGLAAPSAPAPAAPIAPAPAPEQQPVNPPQ